MIGVCVVNYHSAPAVERLLASLDALSLDVRVYVHDNSDEQELLEEIAGRFAVPVDVATTGVNTGYAAGNNAAAARAIADGVSTIWVLNPDIEVLACDGAALEAEVGASRSLFGTQTDERESVTSGLGYLAVLSTRSRRVPSPGSAGGRPGYRRYLDILHVSGHSVLCSAAVWQELGGMDENYFLFFEEADLACRAQRAGIAVRSTTRARVLHYKGLTTGAASPGRQKSVAASFHSSRSCVVFYRIHRRPFVAWAVLARLPYVAIMLLRGGRAQARAVASGLRSGIRDQVR